MWKEWETKSVKKIVRLVDMHSVKLQGKPCQELIHCVKRALNEKNDNTKQE